jgi:hypothetical protein
MVRRGSVPTTQRAKVAVGRGDDQVAADGLQHQPGRVIWSASVVGSVIAARGLPDVYDEASFVRSGWFASWVGAPRIEVSRGDGGSRHGFHVAGGVDYGT